MRKLKTKEFQNDETLSFYRTSWLYFWSRKYKVRKLKNIHSKCSICRKEFICFRKFPENSHVYIYDSVSWDTLVIDLAILISTYSTKLTVFSCVSNDFNNCWFFFPLPEYLYSNVSWIYTHMIHTSPYPHHCEIKSQKHKECESLEFCSPAVLYLE